MLVSVVGPDFPTHHVLFIFHPFDLEEERNRDFEIYLESYRWLLLFSERAVEKKQERTLSKKEKAAL